MKLGVAPPHLTSGNLLAVMPLLLGACKTRGSTFNGRRQVSHPESHRPVFRGTTRRNPAYWNLCLESNMTPGASFRVFCTRMVEEVIPNGENS